MPSAPSHIADKEVEREARRIFRHMEKGFLEPRGRHLYALATAPGGRAKLSVPSVMVIAFAARGWVQRDDAGCYHLTPVGASSVKQPSALSLPVSTQALSPLDFLLRHVEADGTHYLRPHQTEAALRLATDFQQAQMRPRVTTNIEALQGGRVPFVNRTENANVSASDAKRRCLAALDAAGPGLADFLFDVVCLEVGLSDSERQHGLPQRAGKAVLRMALERLAVHYGLQSGTRREGRIDVWRTSKAGAFSTA